MANIVNLTLDQGTDQNYVVTCYVGPSGTTPATLTGYIATMLISSDAQGFKPLLTLTGSITANVVTFSISATQSSALKFAGKKLDAFYQIILTIPDTLKKRLVEGKFTISKEIK